MKINQNSPLQIHHDDNNKSFHLRYESTPVNYMNLIKRPTTISKAANKKHFESHLLCLVAA